MFRTPHRRSPAICGFVLVLALLALSSCISKPAPSTVYALEPLPPATPAVATTAELPGLSDLIMVMPVRLPPQLRQKSIVVEEGGTGPKMLAGHLWAGPLELDAHGFKAGQSPGENAFDSKTMPDGERNKLIIRNCHMHRHGCAPPPHPARAPRSDSGGPACR